jgi:hypothetical protein
MGYGYLCLREENLSFNNNYMIDELVFNISYICVNLTNAYYNTCLAFSVLSIFLSKITKENTNQMKNLS